MNNKIDNWMIRSLQERKRMLREREQAYEHQEVPEAALRLHTESCRRLRTIIDFLSQELQYRQTNPFRKGS